MHDHEYRIETTNAAARIRFAPTFNLCAALVDRHVRTDRGAKVFAHWSDRSLRYAELAENVARVADALASLGVKQGDRVMLFITDVPAFYYGFFGTIRLGAVAVPVNTFLRAADYAYMLQDSGAKVVIASAATLAAVEPALASEGVVVAHRILVDDERPGWLSLDSLVASADPRCEPCSTSPATDCFWLYSSGSTGAPKAAVHQHKDMIYTSQHYATGVLGIDSNDVIFSPPKLFFAYGIGNSLSFPLHAGSACVLLTERPTAENTLAAITRFRPTVYFGVPTLYAAQLASLEQGFRADLSSIRLCVSGGEPLPAAIYERWRKSTGIEILDGIGSSEVLHLYTSNRPGCVRPGSAGPIVPGYEGRIVDADDCEMPVGEPGELVIKGESTATYYWKKPERTAKSMRDGWFHTGDTCYRDADGYYYFCGRGDDMLKVGGIWVAPFEVESALVRHHAVLEAAVVGHADENDLIKPKAFVVLRDPLRASPALHDEIRQFVKDLLAPYKYPRWIEFTPELPKTASGKIQRFRLRS